MNNIDDCNRDQMVEDIRFLVEEIGPRPAGSQNIISAFDFIGKRFENTEYQFLKLPFKYAPQSTFMPYYSVAGAAVLLVAVLMPVFAWFALPVPLLVYALPDIWIFWNRKREKTEQSENLVIFPKTMKLSEVDLFLCSHVDSARQNPVKGKIWLTIQDNLFNILQRVSWMLALFAIFFILNFPLPDVVMFAIRSIGVFVFLLMAAMDIWEQTGHKNMYVPGAHDNASGVAVLLSIADRLDKNPIGNLSIGFLFTDAEETGMHGADSIAEYFRKNDIQQPVVVLDQVGAGKKLKIINSVGRIHPLKSDSDLIGLFKRADPAALEMAYIFRNGDFSSFIRSDIPSVSLETRGSQTAERSYHHIEDNMSVIEPDTLEHVCKTLWRFFHIYQKTRE